LGFDADGIIKNPFKPVIAVLRTMADGCDGIASCDLQKCHILNIAGQKWYCPIVDVFPF
jgi:hypothetical protein